jgi:hypothetical protein
VTIKKQGEHRVDWQISAPFTGEVRLLAKALTDTESDAVELVLDVVPSGLHETKSIRWTTSDENVEPGVHYQPAAEYRLAFETNSHRGNFFHIRDLVRRARLPHDLSVRLHGTNDVEFSAKRHRFADLERIQNEHRSATAAN